MDVARHGPSCRRSADPLVRRDRSSSSLGILTEVMHRDRNRVDVAPEVMHLLELEGLTAPDGPESPEQQVLALG